MNTYEVEELDELDELDKLRAEIAANAAKDPELRLAYQQTRASFAIAESLASLIDDADISIQKLASIASVQPNVLESALNATSGMEIPVESVRRISQALGRQFELLLYPSNQSSPGETPANRHEDSLRNFVRIRFPFLGKAPRRAEPSRQVLWSGFERLLRLLEAQAKDLSDDSKKNSLNHFRDELENWPEKTTPLSFLVGLSDIAAYSIQMGFLETSEKDERAVAATRTHRFSRTLEKRNRVPESIGEPEFRFMAISD